MNREMAESLLMLTYNSGVCVWLLLDTKGTLTRCRKVIFKESFSVIIFFWVIKKLMTYDPMISWLSFPMILVFFSFLDHQLFDPVIFKFKIWWSMDQKTVISWLWSQKWYDFVVMISRKSILRSSILMISWSWSWLFLDLHILGFFAMVLKRWLS